MDSYIVLKMASIKNISNLFANFFKIDKKKKKKKLNRIFCYHAKEMLRIRFFNFSILRKIKFYYYNINYSIYFFYFKKGSSKNFLWASRLWVGRRKEPILGYVPKNDEKKKLVHKELNVLWH